MARSNFIKNVWWSILIRGITLILFGFVFLAWPKETIVTAALILSAFLIANGASQILGGIFSISEKRWSLVWLLLLGAIQIVLGISGFKYPGFAVLKFIMFFGLYLIINGFYHIISPEEKSFGSVTKDLSTVFGILAVITGFLLLFQPIAGGAALFWVLGLYALIAGPLLIAFALRIKSEFE